MRPWVSVCLHTGRFEPCFSNHPPDSSSELRAEGNPNLAGARAVFTCDIRFPIGTTPNAKDGFAVVVRCSANGRWRRVAWANLFARGCSIPTTGKRSLAHATHPMTFVKVLVLSFLYLGSVSSGQTDGNGEPSAVVQPIEQPISANREELPAEALPAHEEVHLANLDLLAGDAEKALEAYARAEELRPDAAEIAFGQGLSHFNLKRFDEAREAFQRAAASDNNELATDAQYGLGACDHAQALENAEELPTAISYLEDAMKQYREVLGEEPTHAAAREANRKAASSWRRYKQQLQEQQEQQESDSENEDQEQDEDQEQQESPNEDGESEEQEKNQDQQSQQDDQEKDQQQKESEQQDPPEQEKESQQQQAKEKQKEQTTREQAKRRLREMMEAMMQRSKNRREPVQLVPPHPVEKDW